MNLEIKFKLYIFYLQIINYINYIYDNLNFFYNYFFINYYSNRIVIKNKKFNYLKIKNNYKKLKYFFDLHLKNKTIYFCNNVNNNINYSKYKFILVNLHSDDKKIDITKIIQGKKYNFMIENNILFDKNFFYLINSYYFNNNLNENNYKFSILDKEIKFINLNNNENIIINNNNYQIIKN